MSEPRRTPPGGPRMPVPPPPPPPYRPTVAPRIVTPQEARGAWVAWTTRPLHAEALDLYPDLLRTVSTEPDRIRAAVLKELEDLHDRGGLDGEAKEVIYGRVFALRFGAPL